MLGVADLLLTKDHAKNSRYIRKLARLSGVRLALLPSASVRRLNPIDENRAVSCAKEQRTLVPSFLIDSAALTDLGISLTST